MVVEFCKCPIIILLWCGAIALFLVGGIVIRNVSSARAWRRHGKACGASGGCSQTSGLWPLMDPAWAIHEVVGQCVALEDHLACPAKRCEDCVFKHVNFLTTLACETASLDSENKFRPKLYPFAQAVVVIQDELFTGIKTPEEAAQALRRERKKLMPLLRLKYGEKFKPILPGDSCTSCGAMGTP